MDFAEPPLQAEIMMSSSMTLSLILSRRQRGKVDSGGQGSVLGAAALDDKDILVADRRLL